MLNSVDFKLNLAQFKLKLQIDNVLYIINSIQAKFRASTSPELGLS